MGDSKEALQMVDRLKAVFSDMGYPLWGDARRPMAEILDIVTDYSETDQQLALRHVVDSK